MLANQEGSGGRHGGMRHHIPLWLFTLGDSPSFGYRDIILRLCDARRILPLPPGRSLVAAPWSPGDMDIVRVACDVARATSQYVRKFSHHL
jgi:hypothetical protein